MKKCKSCGIDKSIDEYYRHAKMKDGHLNRCKTCVKARVKKHRDNNLDSHREYDRYRFHKDPARRAYQYRQCEKHRRNNPLKVFARTSVGNAIRDGRLKKMPCEVCGNEESQAHHDDYSRPLDVKWLCVSHHFDLHRT